MCVLKVYSEKVSFREPPGVDLLPVYDFHDKGEIHRKSTAEAHKNFRVAIDVSDAEWSEFPQQVKDAIEFLKAHREPLKELLAHADDSDAYLDFPLWSRISDRIGNQNDRLPRELIRLCGELGLGIEMAQYAENAMRPVSRPADAEPRE